MAGRTPLETVEQLIEAFHRGDVEAAVALYELDGARVDPSGVVARGSEELRQAITQLVALQPRLTTTAYKVIEAGDLALYCSEWSLIGSASDGSRVELGGRSSDVLRRAADGTWLVAIDNPARAAILDPSR